MHFDGSTARSVVCLKKFNDVQTSDRVFSPTVALSIDWRTVFLVHLLIYNVMYSPACSIVPNTIAGGSSVCACARHHYDLCSACKFSFLQAHQILWVRVWLVEVKSSENRARTEDGRDWLGEDIAVMSRCCRSFGIELIPILFNVWMILGVLLTYVW